MFIDDFIPDGELSEDDILDLVDSSVPNLYFVSHLLMLNNDDFRNRRYLDIYSRVLLHRGEANIMDIYPILFFWLKDFNWPGALKIREFLLKSNRVEFLKAIYQAIILAFDDQDEEWLMGLFTTLADRDGVSYGTTNLAQYAVEEERYLETANEIIELLKKELGLKEF